VTEVHACHQELSYLPFCAIRVVTLRIHVSLMSSCPGIGNSPAALANTAIYPSDSLRDQQISWVQQMLEMTGTGANAVARNRSSHISNLPAGEEVKNLKTSSCDDDLSAVRGILNGLFVSFGIWTIIYFCFTKLLE
jgi:hypothetical protein